MTTSRTVAVQTDSGVKLDYLSSKPTENHKFFAEYIQAETGYAPVMSRTKTDAFLAGVQYASLLRTKFSASPEVKARRAERKQLREAEAERKRLNGVGRPRKDGSPKRSAAVNLLGEVEPEAEAVPDKPKRVRKPAKKAVASKAAKPAKTAAKPAAKRVRKPAAKAAAAVPAVTATEAAPKKFSTRRRGKAGTSTVTRDEVPASLAA